MTPTPERTEKNMPRAIYERVIELNRIHRDDLGRWVRRVWIEWAKTQPNPKPSWLVAYDDLSEPDQEVDRQIGQELSTAGVHALFDHLQHANAFDANAEILAQNEALRGALDELLAWSDTMRVAYEHPFLNDTAIHNARKTLSTTPAKA